MNVDPVPHKYKYLLRKGKKEFMVEIKLRQNFNIDLK